MATMGNFTVHLQNGESSDSLIKRFMKKTKKEKIAKEVFQNTYYTKPSEAKRKKKRESQFKTSKNNDVEQ